MRDIPCELAHLTQIEVQNVQIKNTSDFAPVAESLPTHARTLMAEDGHVLVCFGVMPMWEGVAQAWSMLSDAALKDHPMELSRSARCWLGSVAERDALKRIQATVAADHKAGHRWIKWLGFKNPRLMQNYGMGGKGDFYLYERTY